ncbi:MAG TPA: phosphoribosylformylglycinamidine synthase subunit PurQ, partial [Actinomycetota bacterium]|nr:phosphoribosylformylglycinamidine synthase subunit PurQ [Actinomycetota bacterium]
GEPRVALRYVDNPNGSWQSAAGIANAAGNVGGMMPHPERACEPWLGSDDGRRVLASIGEWCRAVRLEPAGRG